MPEVQAAGRRAAESLMLDTFTAYARSLTQVNELQVETWMERYVTPGKVQARSRQGDTNVRQVTVGGVERDEVDASVHIPMSAPLPAIGWEFECTAVGAGSDPSLLGRRWRVVDVPSKSYLTARRLDVAEVPAVTEGF